MHSLSLFNNKQDNQNQRAYQYEQSLQIKELQKIMQKQDQLKFLLLNMNQTISNSKDNDSIHTLIFNSNTLTKIQLKKILMINEYQQSQKLKPI